MLKYKKTHALWRSPIFIKYVVTFLVILLITSSVIVMLFMYYRAEKKQDILSEVDRTALNTAERIGHTIDTYKNLSIYAILQKSGSFATSYLGYLKSSNESNYNQYEYYTSFVSLANSMYVLNKNIYTVYSFNQNGDVLLWRSIAGNELPFPNISEWREAADAAPGAPLLIEPFRAAGRKHEEDLFGVVRAIVAVPSVEIIGYFAMTVKLEELLEPCAQMQMYNDQNTYIINAQNQVLANIRNREYDPLLDKVIRENTYGNVASEGLIPATVDNDVACVYASYRIPDTDWTLLTSIPLNSLWAEPNRFMYLSLFFTILLLLILFVIVFYIFFVSVTQPINKLIALVKNSGFFPELQTSSDEIKFLSSSFTKFSDAIQNIRIEHYIQQKQLKLEFLQLQINPHFLYGTLETIRMVAETKNNLEVSDMISFLSQILRYSIGTENILATVRRELEMLNNYIRLQQIRHDNELSVCFDLEPDCYDVLLPKLTLQPLVENSITHGVPDKNPIRIMIKGRCAGENVELSVSDNGKGMSEELLNNLQQSFTMEKGSSAHIGLWNVNHRIKLMYGKNYGIHIESTPDVGTVIQIKLPRNGGEQPKI